MTAEEYLKRIENTNIGDSKYTRKEAIDFDEKFHKEASKELVEALENFVKSVENEDIIIMDNIDSDGFGSTGNFLYRQAEKALENHLK